MTCKNCFYYRTASAASGICYRYPPAGNPSGTIVETRVDSIRIACGEYKGGNQEGTRTATRTAVEPEGTPEAAKGKEKVMFNKELEKRVSELEEIVTVLLNRTSEPKSRIDSYTYSNIKPHRAAHYRRPLAAEEIRGMFQELYDHLGLERESIPATAGTPRFEKGKEVNLKELTEINKILSEIDGLISLNENIEVKTQLFCGPSLGIPQEMFDRFLKLRSELESSIKAKLKQDIKTEIEALKGRLKEMGIEYDAS